MPLMPPVATSMFWTKEKGEVHKNFACFAHCRYFDNLCPPSISSLAPSLSPKLVEEQPAERAYRNIIESKRAESCVEKFLTSN